MSRKFKTGDKVRITVSAPKNDPYGSGFRKGSVGEITDYDVCNVYRYEVSKKNGYADSFKPSELTLIERKKK